MPTRNYVYLHFTDFGCTEFVFIQVGCELEAECRTVVMSTEVPLGLG